LSDEHVIQLADLSGKEREYVVSRDNLNEEAREVANERNKLNEEVGLLVEKAKKLQVERDECNGKVSELKEKRKELEREVQTAEEAFDKYLSSVQEKVEEKTERRGPPIRILKQRLKSAEWKLQTTVMSKQQENSLVDEIENIQVNLDNALKNLSEYEKKQQFENQVNFMQNKLRRLQGKFRALIRKSQKYHNDMVELWKFVDSKKKEADEKHKQFLVKKDDADEVHEKLQTIRKNSRQLRGKIHESKKKRKFERDKMVKDLVEEKTKVAYAKFKEGGRLTMEEFTLLVEKGLL